MLESIEFVTWPDLLLRLENGTQFHASMNDRNRHKIDQMTEFPELIIEDYNAHHGMLKSENIEVIVYLERML